jgi:DNA-binding winged helix-turn-helix (wHTH) protein/Tol biopolymer transport system component
MGDHSTTDGRVRAGLFEIDLTNGELYKSGRKVALQQQPFRVLSVLVARPGEIVTREELQSKLWPSDTYVAFDEGLNTAIRKLRAAFGDSADNPRFIETVPRRGYRFIAPLARDGNGSAAIIDESAVEIPASERLELKLPLQESSSAQKLEVPSSTKGKPSPWIAALVLLAIVVLMVWNFRPTLPPPHVVRVRQMTRLGDLEFLSYTDGPRVYFKSGSAAESSKWRSISVEGGESSVANEVQSDWLLQDFSPNGSELLILKDRGKDAPFWKVSLPSGSMQELDPAQILGEATEDAVWSPDGQNIAFVAGASLCIIKKDGNGLRKMATFAGPIGHPVWSPDGRKIRLSMVNPTLLARVIMEVDMASGATREMSFGVASPRPVGWLRGGDYFVFTSRDTGIFDLWAVRETSDGIRKVDQRPVRLTAGPISFDWPLIGQDGKTIFVVGHQPRGAMQRYIAATGKFEPFLGGLAGDHIVYSRDGEWFAYISFPERALWRCRANGQDCAQLTFMPMRMDHPDWSPDGKTIAFHAVAPGKISKGYLVSANGGVPQPLLPDSSTGEQGLYWSPDGSHILYTEMSPAPARIRILDLKTRQITDVPDSPGLSAFWSPDGNYIVAREANRKAKLFDFRTHRWSSFDEMTGDCWWSADSQYLYFHTLNRTPRNMEKDGMFRIHISDRHVEKIMSVPPLAMTGTFGIGTGMMPDGTPLVMKDIATFDLYALDLDLP